MGRGTQIAFRHRTGVGCWSHGRQVLLTLAQRWLLVASSADFCQWWVANHYSGLVSLYFADIGPTADFYSRWQRAIIGDFGKLRKILLWYV